VDLVGVLVVSGDGVEVFVEEVGVVDGVLVQGVVEVQVVGHVSGSLHLLAIGRLLTHQLLCIR
jgi:hypothetical protein